jgi:dihydrofolate reductase
MRLSLIVAASENGCIGRDGDLPWRLPEDLKRFKQVTMGKPIIMGRKTYESIGRPLPGRTNIVVTRQPGYAAPGCEVAGSLADALDAARATGTDEVFIIGGASLYADALSQADTLYLTRVHAAVEGDVYLPPVPWETFELSASEAHPADERHAHAFTFETWRRSTPGR